ncbi:MAG: FHA domain-containing protein [Planctomycetaceae bacterium]
MHRLLLLPERVADAVLAVPLRDGEYVVGRSHSCDIVVNDESVSRRHALLNLKGTVLSITDLGSKNGTFVDDVQVSGQVVGIGQMIRLGSAPYRVALEDRLSAISPSEDDETSRKSAASRRQNDFLTPTQQRVYELMLDGAPEAEIAARLNVSAHTVHTHVKAIYVQFGVHSRAELLARRIRETRHG